MPSTIQRTAVALKMTMRKSWIATLDKWFPPCGPCAFCGHKDKRHRLWDAIMGRQASGETPEEIAHDYGLEMEAVQSVLSIRPYKRRR